MDTPRKKKNFFVNSVMCGGAGGEFSYTIAHRARSLLVWMAKIPSVSFSRWHREFSFVGMLECSAVSRRKLNLLTHMPENREGSDAFGGLLVCDIDVERLLGSTFPRMVFRL